MRPARPEPSESEGRPALDPAGRWLSGYARPDAAPGRSDHMRNKPPEHSTTQQGPSRVSSTRPCSTAAAAAAPAPSTTSFARSTRWTIVRAISSSEDVAAFCDGYFELNAGEPTAEAIREVAEILNLSVKTVDNQLATALRKIGNAINIDLRKVIRY